MSMLVEESSSPVRATNSGLENTKKPDYPSVFFVPVVWPNFRFFPLHLRDLSFSFLLCPMLPVALANNSSRYRHYNESRFFSKLQHTRRLKIRQFFLMDAVAVVCYVKSGKCWRVSDSIFKSPHLFFWDVSAIMTWSRGASDNKNSDHQKKFWTFFPIMHFCPGGYERQGRTKSGSYPELPRIWARMPEQSSR
ncbi:hypothetical protein OQ304_004713 [Escherichia coli]|nr:hypothetical protein [Escherichia coli]EIC1514599.1 hypothetical protein [Escherichia coli]EJF7956383.1 hypothetical protein [Escherichia coli]EKD0794657.1 hypothetical protein [Escherichia coli]